MANRWEEYERERNLKCKCPCGEGGYYVDTVTYRDDYMRTSDEYEEYITCSKCNDKYVYGTYGWIEKPLYQEYKKLAQRNGAEQERINQILLDKYHSTVINRIKSIKTKKALYEIFNKTQAVYIHGSLETFRRNLNKYGIDSYLKDIGSINLMSGFIALVKEFGIGLDTQEEDMLRNFGEMRKEATEYLKLHSIQTSKS